MKRGFLSVALFVIVWIVLLTVLLVGCAGKENTESGSDRPSSGPQAVSGNVIYDDWDESDPNASSEPSASASDVSSHAVTSEEKTSSTVSSGTASSDASAASSGKKTTSSNTSIKYNSDNSGWSSRWY